MNRFIQDWNSISNFTMEKWGELKGAVLSIGENAIIAISSIFLLIISFFLLIKLITISIFIIRYIFKRRKKKRLEKKKKEEIENN